MKRRDLRGTKIEIKMHGKYPAAYIVKVKKNIIFKHNHEHHKSHHKKHHHHEHHHKGGHHGMKFKDFKKKLESKGMSADEAGGIAYDAGAKKYGKKGMAKKAALGRKKAEDKKK